MLLYHFTEEEGTRNVAVFSSAKWILGDFFQVVYERSVEILTHKDNEISIVTIKLAAKIMG